MTFEDEDYDEAELEKHERRIVFEPTELAWAAGIFEGEGTVAIRRPGARHWGHLIASVVNTDRQILDWFQMRWPGAVRNRVAVTGNRRPAWFWLVAAKHAASFLGDIRPYVVRDAVRHKIDVAISYQRSKQRRNWRGAPTEARDAYLEEQWNAYWYMAHLNRRGLQEPCTAPSRFSKGRQ